MDVLQETRDTNKKTFFNQVFSNTEDGKAEILNVVQYALMGIIPVVVLNKLVQRFIPEADTEKSSLEILVEVFIQLIVMFCGIILIHRSIAYLPTYSGFKYETLNLTNIILAFLIITLSIQTKLGIKVNILYDRVLELWEGPSENVSKSVKKNLKYSKPVSQHAPSQADMLDNSMSGAFPPMPVATMKPNSPQQGFDNYTGGSGMGGGMMNSGPMAANGLLGSSFGASF